MNPRTSSIRRDIQDNLPALAEERVSRCIEALEENLAVACVFRFETKASSPGTVRTHVENDLFTIALLFLMSLEDELAKTNDIHVDARLAVQTIAELFARMDRLDDSAVAIKEELIAAYFISLALKNELLGKSQLDGLKYRVFIESDICSLLHRQHTISNVTMRIRDRFAL